MADPVDTISIAAARAIDMGLNEAHVTSEALAGIAAWVAGDNRRAAQALATLDGWRLGWLSLGCAELTEADIDEAHRRLAPDAG